MVGAQESHDQSVTVYVPQAPLQGHHGLYHTRPHAQVSLCMYESCGFMCCHGSKHLPDDWLERMFHSCQHRYTTASHDIHDHPENHPMLMSHMVSVGGAQCVMGGVEYMYIITGLQL